MKHKPVIVQTSGTVLAASLALSLGWSPALGDITSANWVNSTLFNYRVMHMPDLDQRRDNLLDAFGVDCNGSIHCVPTCVTNMVLYSANHGFPSVVPGPGYWEGQTNYALATSTIQSLAQDMSTSCASGGTNGANASAALTAWLANVDGLVVNDHLSLNGFAPTHAGIGQSLCGGRIGSVSYGRYDVIGNLKGVPLVQRDGGHCTTAVKVRRNGATRELWVRDPAQDEGNLNTQSPFANTVWTVTDMTVIVMPDMDQKVMTAINYTPGDAVIRLIDGHRTITPAQGFSWDSSLSQVIQNAPTDLLNPGLPPTTVHPSPTGTPVLDLDWQDLTGELLVICQGSPPTLRAMNMRNGGSGVPPAIPTPIVPNLATVGRSDNVYVCSGSQIATIIYPAPSQPPPPSTPRTLPHTAHTMVYDDAQDEVVLISRTDRKLMRIDDSLAGTIVQLDIPTTVPLGIRLQIALNPTEPGIVYLWSDASNAIWRGVPTGSVVFFTALNLPAAPLPRSLDFNDRGHMLVNNNGTLVELVFGSTGWQPYPNSFMGGVSVGSMFITTRSRSNFTAGVHDTPGWTTNIDPADLPTFPQAQDCVADIAPNLNTDNVVNVNDLLAVILGWGPCPTAIRCVADINADHVVDVNDLLAVITAWGPCQ